MLKNITIIFVVLSAICITTLQLFSFTWKFIPRADIDNNWFKETSNLGSQPIMKLMDSKGKSFTIVEFKNNHFNNISTPEIEQKIDYQSHMYSYENNIYLASGKNTILKLDDNYNWKILKLDDKYNQQNNKFMRITKKIVTYNNSLYCLSEAQDVKFIDTNSSGVITIVLDAKYNELISIEDEKIKLEYSKVANTGERFYDIAADDNSLWISSSNLIRYENGDIKEEIDIYNTLDFDSNIILSHLVVDKNFVYILKKYTDAGTKNIGTYLIRYKKSNGELEKFEFPGIKSYADNESLIKPNSFTNIIIENDKIYISSAVGLYEFSNNELKYIDIFSDFIDEIPSLFLQYLSTENVSIVGNTMYISTNVGLIYSDDFTSTTSVNIAKANFGLDIYPNLITGSQNSLTIGSSESKEVNSIIIYNIEGTEVYKYNNISKHITGSLTLRVPNLSSGSYFIAVITDKKNYISPLIIQN